MDKATADQFATDVALARYSVIAPLVGRNLSPFEHQRERARLLACTHRFPGDDEREISKRTLERWLTWYRNGRSGEDGVVATEPGLEALKPVPRADRGSARVLAPDLIERAVRLRMEEPRRSTSRIVELLEAEAVARGEAPPVVEVATLAYHLRARRLTRRHLKQEGRVFPRYEHDHRNAVWQGDWSQGIALPDPGRPGKTRLCHLHAFIDDHTRYVVHAEFYFRQNLPCLEDCFRKAVLKGGLPERVYWDNGAVYQARQIQLLAGRLGVHVIFATPYHPQGKGKIERFFKTVKDAFYPEAVRAGLQTLDEVNAFFWGWLESSYHERVHSEIEQTPHQRWLDGEATVRTPDPASLVDLFLWEKTAKVDKTGCVQVSGNAYPVSEHLVGREVQVRFDPFDLARVRVYEDGVFVQSASPLQLVAHTHRKAQSERPERPSTLDSAVAYRKTLSGQHRDKVHAIQGAATPRFQREADKPWLTRAEFVAVLAEQLGGRPFTAMETAAVHDFFQRNAPFPRDQVRGALHLAVEVKGRGRHIRYYLDAVRDARLRKEVR